MASSNMYIIETHYPMRAYSKVVIEKGDYDKTYDEFAKHKVIINHMSGTDEASCQYCAAHRKVALLRARKAVIHL